MSDFDREQWQAEQAAQEQAQSAYRDKMAKARVRSASNAKRKIARLHAKLTELGHISDFEDEFGESVLERLDKFGSAFNDLEKGRAGDALSIAQRQVVARMNKKVKELKGSYQDKVKERLTKRFETDASGLNIDEPRFLQEVIYYLEKLDIDEEINRIVIHLEKLEGIFNKDSEVGRQIDFLVQELNRETNTIGSKSGNSDISAHVVQMKVQLEKIREQALNLE